MTKRKLNPREGKLGRFVSPESAEANKEGTIVQTIYLSEAKYKEAEEMLEKLYSLRKEMCALPGILEGKFEVLKWLIADGEKPEIQ